MAKYIYWFLFVGLSSVSYGQDLYDLNQVVDIYMEFSDPLWEAKLDSLKQAGNDGRLIGKVKIKGVTYDSVGIRYKGNSSYYNVRKTKSSKLPFNLKANTVIKGQRFPGDVKTIKLSNVFRDPSYLREVLSYQIAGNYLPAPKANFARVYVNNKLIGFYNNTSSVDGDFLTTHFGEDEGTLVKCDPSWNARPGSKCSKGEKASLMYQGKDTTCYYANYEMKSRHGWASLAELTYVLNKEPEKLERKLNIDRALWMHAFNNVLVNLDSYSGRLCHNYYLYQDSFGIFQPIPWDMNLSFGGFRYADEKKALNNEGLQKLSPFTHYKSPNRPLISQLLATPLYRKVYIAHLKTILEEFFVSGKYQSMGQQIQSQMDRYVREDPNKLYPYETLRENLTTTSEAEGVKIIGITELMKERVAYLQAHPLLVKKAPVISQVKHEVRDSQILITAKVTEAASAYLCYRTGKYAPFQRVKMLDDGAHADQAAGDNYYGQKIPYEKGVTYYLIGEAEKTASTAPARAAMEYYEVR